MIRQALRVFSAAGCLMAACVGLHAEARPATPGTLQTQYATFEVDNKGYITSILSRQSGKEYSPAGHPSPLMSLHENDKLIAPLTAAYNAGKQTVTLKYPKGVTAVVKLQQKEKYLRLQLISLEPRGKVDAIIWGPLNNSINKLMGEIIGVVRDPTGNWAIGMMGLDDNTIPGLPEPADCYRLEYVIHSPDPDKYPVPAKYKEGQVFNIGGNGANDVAYYSHPEDYFQLTFGNGARVRPEFGSAVFYTARDRRLPRSTKYSMLPHFPKHRAKNQMIDPVDVDFIGSAVAIYACPDDQGLKTIETIILAEGLPYPKLDGKWIKDPSALKPDIMWHGRQDKMINMRMLWNSMLFRMKQ